jgi:hypothetical protein
VLVLSIGLWCVVVCSLRVALFGNPLYRHVARADPDLLTGAERIATHANYSATDSEVRFLQRFSRLTLLELGVFLLEIGLLLYLWLSRTMEWLAFALLMKNLILMAVSAAIARAHSGEGIFESLLALPGWLIAADRVSAFVSGAGCLVLFLVVNNILPG